jgi:plasmid maintenance system antidote protein VapI
MTADTALPLAPVFGTSPRSWMNLQASHDLSKAAIAARDELMAIEPVEASAVEHLEAAP